MWKDKLAAITGGSSGLGLAMARMLLAKGARVALLARDMQKLVAAREELESVFKKKSPVAVFSCDVADAGSVARAFGETREILGVPDVLVNSAGILREGRLADLAPETFRSVMDINFFGTLNCIKAVLPGMLERKSGRIVNISSVAGRMGVFGYTAYCASKHAVSGLTGSLHCELAGSGVEIHIAYPPEFESPMVTELEKCRTPENRAMARTIPVMKKEDVAEIIIRGVEKGRYEIVPGLPSRLVVSFNQWFPSTAFSISRMRLKRAAGQNSAT